MKIKESSVYLPKRIVIFKIFSLSLIFFVIACVIKVTHVHPAEYSGVVVDPKGSPIDNAIVRFQGTSFLTSTDSNGFFKICINRTVDSKHITAWKDGYYNGGTPIPGEDSGLSIMLKPILKEDNPQYAWIPSLHDSLIDSQTNIKPCQHCHAEITEEWRKSTHGSAAINPVFLSFFDGESVGEKKGAGPSYKTDFPNSNGNCTTCHVPAMALKNPFNSNPREARGVEKEGVFCDLCHKVDGVRMDSVGGSPGALSLRFNRPSDGHQIFYGPYDDVFPGDDSYHPLYKESRYCAPCHNGKFWNILIYSEFEEWAQSTYAKNGTHCQNCHMVADGTQTRFAPEMEGGIKRRPETIPSHVFNGVHDRDLMTEAIDLDIQTELTGGSLVVIATVKNVKAGHHYPTGNPMRNMLLLVKASGENGYPLPFVSGTRVPDWGGIGPVEKGNYAGLPGKGFAKILRDTIAYPDSNRQRHFQPEYPAPHWRPVIVESDNRIPANGADISRYEFSIPADLHGSIQVTASLIFRRSFKKWMDNKGFAINDMDLAQKSQTVRR